MYCKVIEVITSQEHFLGFMILIPVRLGWLGVKILPSTDYIE